jgi:RND family efflux transporter MFP subunit
MNKERKTVVALLVVLLATLAGVRIWKAIEIQGKASSTPGAGSRTGGTRVVSVVLAQAQSGTVRDEIEITGSLKPKEQVDISSQVTGRVQRLTVLIGDPVRQGQLIAELEDDELKQQVRRGEAASNVVKATLAQRRAELSNARIDMDRAKQLLDASLISRQDFDTKQTAFRVVESQLALAEAQGEQAAAELSELKIKLQQMRIESPMSGYVAQRYVDVGAVVSPSTPIVRVVNLSTLVTVANVPERAISKLRVGNRANVRVDAFGDEAFSGRVARVSPVLDAATRTAAVEVEIPNSNGILKAEMFARVTLDLGTNREAVLIPRESLVYRGQQPGVFIIQSQRPAFRTVETGVTLADQVEVLTNLAAGTTIVGRGASLLSEGDQIRVVQASEADRLERENLPKKPGARLSSALTTGFLVLRRL